MESSWLLNKFSLSSPWELYQEQYGDVHVAITLISKLQIMFPSINIISNIS